MVLRHTKSKNKIVTVHAIKEYGRRRDIVPFINNIGSILRCVRLHDPTFKMVSIRWYINECMEN